MKKFFFLFLLLVATPAMADLTCKTTEGCTSSNPAKDCEALGYEAKTSLDKDCEHSLQCPFSKDYAKCVKWETAKDKCISLGYHATSDDNCGGASELREVCPYDSYYVICKNQASSCKALGFVEQASYHDGGTTKYYLPYCWDQIDCRDDTGVQYALCVKGEYMPLCSYWKGDLCPDDDSESDFNTRVVTVKGDYTRYAFTDYFITPLLKGCNLNCTNCGRCLLDTFFDNNEQDIHKGNLLALKEELKNDTNYIYRDNIKTYCYDCGDKETTSYNIIDYQGNGSKLDTYSICRTPDNCSGGDGGGSGDGDDETSYYLCDKCNIGDYVDKNGHCQKSKDGAVAQVYFKTKNLNLIEFGHRNCSIGEENCYVKAAALKETKGSYELNKSHCSDAYTKAYFEAVKGVYDSWKNSKNEDELYNMFYTSDNNLGQQIDSDFWFGGGEIINNFHVENDASDWHWYVPTFWEIQLSSFGSNLSTTPGRSENKCGVWTSENYGADNPVFTNPTTDKLFHPHVILYQGCRPKHDVSELGFHVDVE